MVPTSIEEAYRKFDELSAKHIEKLRKLTKNIQDAKIARDNEVIKNHLKQYDEELEKYIPVLMAQARIYWERENYPMVEKFACLLNGLSGCAKQRRNNGKRGG
jgi:tetratricopeptide repeat protein 30